MNNLNCSKQSSVDYVAVCGRWVVGVLFVYTGLSKAMHPELFLKLVDQYQMVREPLVLNSIAAALPWFEVFCGFLLLAGVAVRGAGLMLVLMLAPFTLVVLRRALAIAGAKGIALCAVKFDCGCGMGEVFACRKVVENCLLILISCLLIAGRGRSFALRFSLMNGDAPREETAPESKTNVLSRP